MGNFQSDYLFCTLIRFMMLFYFCYSKSNIISENSWILKLNQSKYLTHNEVVKNHFPAVNRLWDLYNYTIFF